MLKADKSMITYNTKSQRPPRGAVIALGYFDGVHLGHRGIIAAAAREAGLRGAPCAVWMPDFKEGVTALTTGEEKFSLLAEAGAEFAVVSDFDSVCGMTGEEFVREVLVRELGAVCAVCGFNFRFGRGASCGVAELKEYCEKYGIGCVVAEPVTFDGEIVSSSWIRSLLCAGETEKAAKLLGRPCPGADGKTE